ncbi:MAG: DUF2680 domain-containing protein [Bacillus sp. (in: firmicutes)]
MKKMIFCIAAFCFIGFFGIHSPIAAGEADTSTQEEQELTPEQLAEVKKIHQTILNEKKRLIGLYVEYGQMTEEEGEKLISRFDKHYEMAENYGFQIPKHHPFKKGKQE